MAQYHQTRNQNRDRLFAVKYFKQGIEAMVRTLADEFIRFDRECGGQTTVTCEQVAQIIERAPRPHLPAT